MPSARPKSATYRTNMATNPVRKTDKDLPLIEDTAAGAHSGRCDSAAGRRAGLRAGRAGAPAIGGLQARCRRGGRQGAQEAAQGTVQRSDGERDSRLHLLLAPGQSGRRPPLTSAAAPCSAPAALPGRSSIEVALARLRWADISTATVVDTLAEVSSRRADCPPTGCSARAF